jgi:hypothetical protein
MKFDFIKMERARRVTDEMRRLFAIAVVSEVAYQAER